MAGLKASKGPRRPEKDFELCFYCNNNTGQKELNGRRDPPRPYWKLN